MSNMVDVELEWFVHLSSNKKEGKSMRALQMSHKIALLLCAVSTHVAAFAPTNFFEGYETALMYPRVFNDKECPKRFELGLTAMEFGSRATGRNYNEDSRNILQINDDVQLAVSMLQNPQTPSTVAATQQALLFITNVIGLNPNQIDTNPQFGNTGNELFTGKLSEYSADLYAKYTHDFRCIPGTVAFGLYLPVKHKKVYSFFSQDLTNRQQSALAFGGVQAAQLRVLTYGDLVDNVQTYGNLSLANWNKTGIGDLTAMIEWYYSRCEEECSDIKGSIFAKIGVSFPTSTKKDENKALSMAFGNDGSWSLPMGLSLAANLYDFATVGIDGEVNVIFSETKNRRLKTDPAQTEFLLLNVGRAEKEPGVTWQLHPYVYFHPWSERCIVDIGYQYVHHSKDKLKVKNDRSGTFDNDVVNSARSLGSWHVHNIFARLAVQFCSSFDAAFFYKPSVGGKKVINTNTFGIQGRFRF